MDILARYHLAKKEDREKRDKTLGDDIISEQRSSTLTVYCP